MSDNESATLSPEEAFAVLGNETRLTVLETLAVADGPLTYSELFNRIEYDDSANYSYHLDKLVGHFVRKTDEGYEIEDAGRRVVEAVLSGAVTETPRIEPTTTDHRCPFCSAPIEVEFRDGRVELNCTECPGFKQFSAPGDRRFTEYGTLGFFYFPPAGTRGRSAASVLDAAWTWRHVDFVADSSGVCSRCSAPLEHSVTVCADHDTAEETCEQCGRRYAARFEGYCTNCNYEYNAIAPGCLLDDTDLLAFLASHGVNPLTPDGINQALGTLTDYEEEVVSTEPFKANFTFTIGDETLTLTVGEDLEVIDTERRTVS